jgi:hypothetical protein
MVGRCAASAIASASLQSFFCPFEYGRTCFAGISLTALDAIERRAVYSAAHKAKRREVAEMTDGCESDNKGTARSLPFAKVIEHDVLGGAEMGRQAWHGRRKMGTPNLMNGCNPCSLAPGGWFKFQSFHPCPSSAASATEARPALRMSQFALYI